MQRATTKLLSAHLMPPLTRRAFLRALLAALAIRARPLATRFSQLADELARLTCWRSAEFEGSLQPA